MPDGSYKRDALQWALSQAALLRCLAAGERTNDAVDWPHIIDELEDVGLSTGRHTTFAPTLTLRVRLARSRFAARLSSMTCWRRGPTFPP